MIVLGLTGSIGMGKSATASMFKEAGLPVYDADAAVHSIYQVGGSAVGPLSDRFPDAVVDGAVDRNKLRQAVLNDAGALKDLETIVHPLVGETQLKFRDEALASGAPVAVLDIPLLYETGGDARCDYVAVVSAPAKVQRERVLSRPGMTQAAFEAILSKQVPDAEKRAKADFIISSAFGFDFARAHVTAIVELLTELDHKASHD
ncbi:MAG: dephospho-CoA kinase [Henriciella sp.]|nr:dephospho-CoA kinase [Henriciella sp.]